MEKFILNTKCSQPGCNGELVATKSYCIHKNGGKVQVEVYRCQECGNIETEHIEIPQVNHRELFARI